MDKPDGLFPAQGAYRKFPLSRYIKHRFKKIDAYICDELHEYSGESAQGEAMAEIAGITALFFCFNKPSVLFEKYICDVVSNAAGVANSCSAGFKGRRTANLYYAVYRVNRAVLPPYA